MKFGILALIFLNTSLSFAFDLEDYATTYRATRDAYLKALNEAALARNAFDQIVMTMKGYEKACLRLNLGKDDRLVGFDGVFTGACNKDGQLPHPTGGAKLSDGSPKFGDQWSVLLNLAPVTSLFPYRDMEDIATTYRARRDERTRKVMEAYLSSQQVNLLERIPNCVVQDKALEIVLGRNGLLDDEMTTYRASRDAFFKSVFELELATGPYMAAKKAYEASVTVYNVTTDCDTTMGRSPIERTDPYDWNNN